MLKNLYVLDLVFEVFSEVMFKALTSRESCERDILQDLEVFFEQTWKKRVLDKLFLSSSLLLLKGNVSPPPGVSTPPLCQQE